MLGNIADNARCAGLLRGYCGIPGCRAAVVAMRNAVQNVRSTSWLRCVGMT
ncbi:hypothetical protein BLIG_01619 [Bifidobacterium longum subsp. infantis CCUG 52486]|uniref:Uncharacterized protein n=1 Tax=Bifidobacterium longum subsp. infantis CCUG 52486 TaxID=537937 RepID=C5EBA1_BIFLI|nr:hypothetical protein BLIG_01619 [Bifidobacterium longum subsp. infantis CCUG 52486]